MRYAHPDRVKEMKIFSPKFLVSLHSLVLLEKTSVDVVAVIVVAVEVDVDVDVEVEVDAVIVVVVVVHGHGHVICSSDSLAAVVVVVLGMISSVALLGIFLVEVLFRN